MSELALQLIRQAKAEGSTTLDLGNTGLTELPEELFELEQLETLIISDEYWDYKHKRWIKNKHNGGKNSLKGALPNSIARLKKLKHLDLGGPKKWNIEDISVLGNLINLRYLDLSANQISNIEILKKLVNLNELYLNSNKISDINILQELPGLNILELIDNQIKDIAVLENLSNLTRLYLSDNNLIDDFSIIEKLTNLRSLSLGQNNIEDINFLSKLSNLIELSLFQNKIRNINVLKKLPNLKWLDLSDNRDIKNLMLVERIYSLNSFIFTNNQLSDIWFLKDLHSLNFLDLRNNFISDVYILSNLENLNFLNLRENIIKDISPLFRFIKRGIPVKWGNDYLKDGIYLENNPLEIPPVEVVKEGNAAILNYFKELEEGEEIVYEARLLILGEAGSGKTTLSRKIENAHAEMPDEVVDTTTGINIRTQVLAGGAKQNDFTMHVWDFGGQEIYHATHQFFLSKRSLYVLLADGRREESLDYWLQVQELFGKDSPLLIVFNQKGTIHQDVPIAEIRGFYQNVKDFKKVNLKDDINSIQSLQQNIENCIRQLPHLERGEKVPKKWAKVRAKLSDIPDNHIAVAQFRAICVAEGLDTRERQDFLSDYLHDLGVLLHFKDVPYLNKLVILKPEWATNAVYRVLDHTKQQNKAGHFSKEDLQQVWDCEDYLDYADELLQLMERFELCYPVAEDKNLYIVPQLLPGDKTSYNWDDKGNLQLVYAYDFLPKGIVTRLIVRLHKSLENQQHVWKRGAIFQYDQTRAEVIENQRDKRITIKAKGWNTRGLVSIIAKEMDEINSTFHFNERMKVRKLYLVIVKLVKTEQLLGKSRISTITKN